MSLSELLPVVQSLPHHDKLSLLQFLVNTVAQEEGLSEIQPGTNFELWSPYGAFEAAQTLQEALQADGGNA